MGFGVWGFGGLGVWGVWGFRGLGLGFGVWGLGFGGGWPVEAVRVQEQRRFNIQPGQEKGLRVQLRYS